MAFGVTTDNIFSLLDEENEDPQALASKTTAAQEPKAKKDAAAKPKDAAKPAVATGVEARMRGLATGDGAARGRGRGPPRGGFGGRGRGQYDRPAGDGDAIDAGSTPAANRGRSRGGRENGRGGRGGRGAREGQESRPPRRQYDRKDGTGRGNEMEKRGGAGRGNWGAEGEEIKEEADKVVSTEEAKPEEEAAPAEEPVAEEVAPPQGEEEKEMTLDEYEKMMEEKRANLNKPAAPKPTTSDEKAFEGMKAYTRKDLDEADDLENELELKNKKQIGVRKSGAIAKDLKPKETIKANFRVGDDGGNSGYSSRPRGGRSGRMSGGREGRNGPDRRDRPDREDRPPREDRPLREDRPYREDRPPREDRPQRSYNGPRNAGSRTGPAPSINDASAFPTLS